jgi:hypothetical protein
MAACGEQKTNTRERGYKQGRKRVLAMVAGTLVAALHDILLYADGVADCCRPSPTDHGLENCGDCLNGRPEWTRTIDLLRVREAL